MSEKKIRRIEERNPWKYSDLGRVSERCDEIEKASRHFGKDEVSSSNLDSSSKKLPKSVDFRSFCSIIRQNNEGQKVGQAGRPTT